MEYVHGETLSKLIGAARRARERIPPRVASAIMGGVLEGLHAAHEAAARRGEPLGIVHRDVSPQNVLVGADGIGRLVDFGVAKARGRTQVTEDGQVKGKFGYMSPEQLAGGRVDRRTDVWAAGVVLWETLVGARLFAGADGATAPAMALTAEVPLPSQRVPDLPAALDDVVLGALTREPQRRLGSALEMARRLHAAVPPATAAEVGDWVREHASAELEARAAAVARVEQGDRTATTGAFPVLPASPTVVTVPDRPPPAARWRIWAVLATAGVAGAVVATILLRSPDDVPAAAAVSPAAAREPVSVPVPAPVPVPVPVQPLADPPPAPAKRPPRVARHKPAAPARKAAANPCEPPYTIDDQGHKRYKRECFQ
jgi:serine/threonine-protein kinase